jgi:hypothetical protein
MKPPVRIVKYVDTCCLGIIGAGGLGTSHSSTCTDGYNTNHIGVKIAAAILKAAYDRNMFYLMKKVNKIYVLCVDGEVGHWTCPYGVRDSIKYWLDQFGIPYTVVNSMDKWWNLLTNPEENVAFVNCHGEGVPVPPQYGWIYNSTDGWNANYKSVAYNFYVDLLTTIKDNRWLWIEPIGYTWYNAFQNGVCTCQKGALGAYSVDNAFKNVFGFGCNCWGYRTYKASLLMKQLFKDAYGESIDSFYCPRGFKIGTDFRLRVHWLGVNDKYHVGLITPETVLLTLKKPIRMLKPVRLLEVRA